MSMDTDRQSSSDEDADSGSDESANCESDDRDRVRVGVAELAVVTDGSLLVTSGLGSCVGVAVADPASGVAGLAHVMLPETPEGREGREGVDESARPAKSAPNAVEHLLAAVEDAGADPDAVEAKLAGGSRMFDFSGVSEGVGRRNVEAVRSALADRGVRVVAEDVGGSHGRSLEVDPASWTLTVTSAHGEEVEL